VARGYKNLSEWMAERNMPTTTGPKREPWQDRADDITRERLTPERVWKDRPIVRSTRPEPEVRQLYWAYGSNLNAAQMEKRCPGAKYRRALYVDDCALVFRGVADVTVKEGSRCPGALWSITARDEAKLDRYEGVGSGAYRKSYFKLRGNKKVYRVLFYQMNDEGIQPPSETYLKTIEQGYVDCGLDPAYLDVALQQSWAGKDVTEYLAYRHRQRGAPNLAKDLIITPRSPSMTDDEIKPDTSEPAQGTILLPPPAAEAAS